MIDAGVGNSTNMTQTRRQNPLFAALGDPQSDWLSATEAGHLVSEFVDSLALRLPKEERYQYEEELYGTAEQDLKVARERQGRSGAFD